MLTTPKARNAKSSEVSACGVIKMMQTQTPIAHERLKSAELFLLINLIMSGILNSGKTTPATVPIHKIQSFTPIKNEAQWGNGF